MKKSYPKSSIVLRDVVVSAGQGPAAIEVVPDHFTEPRGLDGLGVALPLKVCGVVHEVPKMLKH